MAKTPTPAKRQKKKSLRATVDVFTLPEAAAFLRVSEVEVLRLLRVQKLPGQRVDQGWRFLRSAIEDWLRTTPKDSDPNAGFRALVGAWKDDPDILRICEEAYRERGRPMVDPEE